MTGVPGRRLTSILAALVAAGVLASCSADGSSSGSGERSSRLERQGDKDQRNRETSAERTRGDRDPGRSRGQGGGGREGSPGADDDTSTNPGVGGSASSAGSPAAPPDEPAVACVDDAGADPEGSGDEPAHADLRRGCLREDGRLVRLEAFTGGALPTRMPDSNSQLSYGFAFTLPAGDTRYVYAEASAAGWSGYVSDGDGRKPIAAPVVSGRQLTLTVPLSEVDGATRWQWLLESSWTRSTLTSTSYAFDSLPDSGTTSFDRG